MYTTWMIAGMLLGAVATVIVWGLIVALVVAWVQDHHRHHWHAP